MVPAEVLLNNNSALRTSTLGLHWTPNGVCRVTGIKERNQPKFYTGNPFKNKFTKKLKSPSNLHEKSLIN